MNIVDLGTFCSWNSGGTGPIREETEEKLSDLPKKEINIDGDHENRIQAARERFLSRKAKKWASFLHLMVWK